MSDDPQAIPLLNNARPVRDKIVSLDELARISATLRAKGRVVVLCHGVFDLLHMGHVRHLETAKREGDVLMVTVTDDRHVNKGPGRPIFPDHMRAEMLAAVQYVDFVAINNKSTAEPVLRAVKPNVYVKGSDYENPESDVSGGITRERKAVEDHDGRIVFTRDVTFSSSSLINRYLDVYDPPLRDYLESFRAKTTIDDLLVLLESVRNYRVLVIGDTIIDEYQYVEALGKPSKENIIATRSKGSEIFAGGVIAAANHVAGFCEKVEIITLLGAVNGCDDIISDALRDNIKLNVVRREGAPTTRKTRFVESSYVQKLFEVYSFDDTPLDVRLEAELNTLIESKIADFDVVIVADFGHGLISAATVDLLTRKAPFLAVNTQTNAGNHGFNLITKYSRADYICIDGGEARLAVADKFGDLAIVTGQTLPQRVACPKIIVTAGVAGCYTFDRANGTHRMPAFTKTVVDTVGAGDAFFAVTAPLVAVGGDMERVGFIGNIAGALKVGIVGHRASVERVPLVKYLTTLLK